MSSRDSPLAHGTSRAKPQSAQAEYRSHSFNLGLHVESVRLVNLYQNRRTRLLIDRRRQARFHPLRRHRRSRGASIDDQRTLWKTLPITGPEALSFGEVTAKIGSAIGRQLTFQSISDEDARQRYSPMSGSEAETEAHVSLWRAIREGRLSAVTNTVERVAGRKPFPLDQWIAENAAAFR